jgi:hypothetical protein
MQHKTFARLLFYIALASTFGLFALIYVGRPLPPPENIDGRIVDGVPEQVAVADTKSFDAEFGEIRYSFTPHARYDLYGLVVSLHHSGSFIDISHKNDPAQTMDICVVWGENIVNNAYRMVTYNHGDFTCFWSWDAEPPPFNNHLIANNHLIPTTPELAKLLSRVHVGDQIRLGGTLADYIITNAGGQELGSRNSSLVRTDTGNGACEIILLTDAEIIAKHMPWREPAMYALGTLALIGFVVGFMLGLPKRHIPPPVPPGHIDNPYDPKNFITRG